MNSSDALGESLRKAQFPRASTYDPQWLIEEMLEIPVQVNGKLRDRLRMKAEAGEEEIKAAALGCEKVKPLLEGKTIKRVIVVGRKLVNIAVA